MFLLQQKQNRLNFMNKKTFPVILSIAGSDSCGGAGIQADIKTISALGAYAATVITAVTAQNTLGVTHIFPISAYSIEKQLEAVMSDLAPATLKIGMLNEVLVIKTIAKALRRYQPKHVVLDPVMVSASGSKLIDDNAMQVLIEELFPLAEIVTPNLEESELLTGMKITSTSEMSEAAARISSLTHGAVLVKGTHLRGEHITDILLTQPDGKEYIYTDRYIPSKNLHGAGCSLSSAIAVKLELGYSLQEAVEQAKSYIHQAILHSKDIKIGMGVGPLCHSFHPEMMKVKE